VSNLRGGDVMIVAAFAGSGKTMLLAEWFTNDRTSDGAWLTLDARDNEPSRFAALVAHALGAEGAVHLPRRGRWRDTLGLDLAFEEFNRRTEPFVLVLDDVHELTAPSALHALEHLLLALPPTLTVVLLTRADPPVPLGRLILEGRLQQIRADELALTLAETEELLVGHDVALDAEHLELLHTRTNGWSAGLRLAALALNRERDPERFVIDTVRSDTVMSEYLMQEVLERYPDHLQQFLLRTSAAQPLTIQLAEILSGDPDAGAHLALLEGSGVFVTRADEPVSQYRFHALLQTLLYARLRHTDAAEARALSAQAAHWFCAHDMPAEGETHAFAATEWKLGATLACTRWAHAVVSLGWVSGLNVDLPPSAPTAEVAELALIAAIDATVIGDRRTATLWRSRADALFGKSVDVDGDVEIARLLLDVFFGRAFGTDTRSLAACRILTSSDFDTKTELLHAFVRLRQAELLLETDDEEGTLRALLDARWRATRNAAPWIVEECDGLLGLIGALSGRLDACDALLAPEREYACDDARRLARILCNAQRGKLQCARSLLATERPSATSSHAMRTSLDEAGRRLGPLSDALASENVAASPLIVQVRIALGALDVDCQHPAERQVAMARDLVERRRFPQVVELLRHFAETRDQHVHLRTRVEAMTLLAIAADAAGDQDVAAHAVRAAIDLATPADLRAPFLTHASLFGSVLDRYAWQLVGESRYAVDLGDDLRRDEPPAFLEPLTDREHAVLDYLPTMMSNAEIAQQLLVSVNTVKTHLKAVYRKLGVDRRRDAVIRARQLELL
jgi:LuxR family maltose regulon positive regulatory protein